ncbi:MAG: NAD(P)/FAD-dependent oxidoreductase [Candidatus Dormibacteria bacterium]
MEKRRVVIVGAGGAGDACAFALRREGFDGDILLAGIEPEPPYDRPYLSKEYLRGEVAREKVFLHTTPEFADGRIDLRTGVTALRVVAARREVEFSTGPPADFDDLVLATGGSPRPLAGAPVADNVHYIRSLADADRLRGSLEPGGRVLVVGAGFIGAEVAASARSLGHEVTMIEAGPVPLGRALGTRMGERYARLHRDRGVDFRAATTVERWRTDGDRATGVELSDGSHLDAQAFVIGVGIEALTGLASDCGLTLADGGIQVDASLSAAPGVWCAGDVAAHAHPVFGRNVRAEHWEVAKYQGRAVARNIVSGAAPYTRPPYFWSEQYGVMLEYVGSASGEHQQVVRGDADSESFSVFYLRHGLVDAVLSYNDTPTRKLAAAIIANRQPVDPAQLSDPGADLAPVPAGA